MNPYKNTDKENVMKRVWLNHWFSTAYNIINLINADNNFVIIGTNESISSPIKSVCNEWYTERKLDDNSYIEFCLDFCRYIGKKVS